MNTESIEPSGTTVSIASTTCNNCIFAHYEDSKQIGCKADRLDKFIDAQVRIVPVEYEDTTSFVIDGKTCVYYRNKDWVVDNYADQSEEEILHTVKKELKIPYHAILFFREEDQLDDVRTRLDELEKQHVKPKIVTVIDRSHTENVVTGDLMKLFQEYSFAYWRVQSIQAVDQLDSDVVDLAYDNTKKKQYMFYMIFECTQTIPLNMSQELHISLHDDMQSFVILLPNAKNNGKTVLKIAHEKYSGNAFTIPLEDKIVHYDDAPHLIRKIEDLCPSLKVS